MQGRSVTRWPWSCARQACACAQESSHRKRSVWGGGAARAFAARARHAARGGFGHPAQEGRHAGDGALFFDARPWCHALALASRIAGLRMCTRERPPHAFCVGRKRSRRVCRARAPHRASWFWPSDFRRPPRWRQGSLVWCLAAVARTDLGLARARHKHVRKRSVTARALCWEKAKQACLPSARATSNKLELALRL